MNNARYHSTSCNLRVLSVVMKAFTLRKTAMESTFGEWYPNAEILEIGNSGHNPMQEVPVSLATAINQHLLKVNK